MDTLTITEKHGANYIVLELGGVISSYTFSDFRAKTYAYIKENNLVLDLSQIQSIDSSGLGVFMAAFNDAEDYGNTFYLMNPSVDALNAINSTGFTDTFNIIHSVTEVV